MFEEICLRKYQCLRHVSSSDGVMRNYMSEREFKFRATRLGSMHYDCPSATLEYAWTCFLVAEGESRQRSHNRQCMVPLKTLILFLK